MAISMNLGINPMLLALAREGRGQEGGPLRRAFYRGLLAAVDLWHRQYLPQHFTARAPNRYAPEYTPRAVGYAIRKARRGAAGQPMVWTGQMKAALTAPGSYRVGRVAVGSRKLQVTCTLAYARAANLWNGSRLSRRGNRINFHRELAAVAEEERQALAGLIETQVRDELEHGLSETDRVLTLIEVGGRGARQARERFFGVFGGAGAPRGAPGIGSLFGSHQSIDSILAGAG